MCLIAVAMLLSACARKYTERNIEKPNFVFLEEHPSPPPAYCSGKAHSEDEKYLYFVGHATKANRLETAIRSGFADAANLINSYLGMRVNYRYDRERIQSRLENVSLPPDPEQINRIMAKLSIAGSAVLRKVKTVELYYKRYLENGHEYYDACVMVRYPKSEEKRLEYLRSLIGSDTIESETVDEMLPRLRFLTLEKPAENTARIVSSLVWLAAPEFSPPRAVYDDNAEIAYASKLGLEQFMEVLRMVEEDGMLILKDWNLNGPQESHAEIELSGTGGVLLDKISRIAAEMRVGKRSAIMGFAAMSRLFRDYKHLSELIQRKRDGFINSAAENDPLFYLEAAADVMSITPDWSADLLLKQAAELQESTRSARNINTRLGDVFLNSFSAYDSLLKTPLGARDSKAIEAVENSVASALDLCILSGLYDSPLYHKYYNLLDDISKTKLDGWKHRWGLERLDQWESAYNSFNWSRLLRDYSNSLMPSLDRYTGCGHLLLTKTYFWLNRDEVFQKMMSQTIRLINDIPSDKMRNKISNELILLSLLFKMEASDSITPDPEDMDKLFSMTDDRITASHPVSLALKLLYQARFKRETCRASDIIRTIESMRNYPLLPAPEKAWIAWSLYRYLETIGATSSLKAEILNWLMQLLPYEAELRGVSRTEVEDRARRLSSATPIFHAGISGRPWVFSTSDTYLLRLKGTVGSEGEVIELSNNHAGWKDEFKANTLHIQIERSVPIEPGWNTIRIRCSGRDVLLLPVFNSGGEHEANR